MTTRYIHILIFFILIPVAVKAQMSKPLVLTLEQARAYAENNSVELNAMHMELLARKYSYDMGVRAFFPTLSVGFSQSDAVTTGAASDTTKKSVSFSLHQPLFDGGRTIFQRKVQKLELVLMKNAHTQKREVLLDQTRQIFFQFLLSREKRRLQNELHGLALQQLEISRTERRLGAITEIDLVDTELEIKRLEADMRKTAMEEEVILYQLQMLCGIPRDRPVIPRGEIDFSYSGISLDSDPATWLGIALDRNMEYQQMRYQVEKSREELRIAETTYIPTIGADVSFSLSGDNFPLYEPGFALKLTFEFPFNEAPTKVNMDTNSNFVDRRGVTAGVSSEILPSLNFLADGRLARLNVRMMNLQLESNREGLRFGIEQFLKKYAYAADNLQLRKETLALLKRKQRVTEEQLGIGEIKRIDYDREEIGIREDILAIMELERGFEQLLGLEAGELTSFRMEEEK
jgi:outer membrane protein TolC